MVTDIIGYNGRMNLESILFVPGQAAFLGAIARYLVVAAGSIRLPLAASGFPYGTCWR